MMVYQNTGSSEEIMKMDMEYERKTTFSKGRPCSRQTGIFVFLGTVCIIIMILSAVIFSNQERKFSMLESWMNSHTSDLTSVKSDFQITGNELEKKVSVLQNLVSRLSSSLMSGSSNPTTKDSLTPSCIDPDWIPFSRSCYLFSSNTVNWTQAKDHCEEQGALLLKLEDGSEKEWNFVTGFTSLQPYWVGLTDQNTGEWRWADDSPYTMNKAHWKPGQPDEWTEHGLGELGEEGEDCGQIAYGVLNDIHCSSKMKYICKKGISDGR